MDKERSSRLTLRSVRKRLHISQTEIAHAMGVTSGAVCQLENSMDPKFSSLQRWARAAGGELGLVLAFPRNDGSPVIVPLKICSRN